VVLVAQTRIDEIRARYRLSDVVGRVVTLRKAGLEFKACCPFHDEKTPSFYVNDDKGFYHCFGCQAHGDAIRFVMETRGVGFREAVQMIDGDDLPIVNPADRARAVHRADRLDVEAIDDARRFWEQGVELTETPADLYLMFRGIRVRPKVLRFARIPTWKNPETGSWNRPRPALMLKAEANDGSFRGIQRIFLTKDGRKANMENPKLSLGSIRGAGISLGRPRPEVHISGSTEDGLSIFQKFNEAIYVRVTCGESNLGTLDLPRCVRRAWVMGQNDKPGREAVFGTPKRIGALRAYREKGIEVRALFPAPEYKDWNDELLGKKAA
jgi:DNA primase